MVMLSLSPVQSTGQHIDPLGIPTQLAVLTFQPRYSAAKCKAVLWGFLKKFIFQEVRPCFSDSKGLGEWMFQAQLHEQSQDLRTVSFDASMVLKHIVAYEGDLSQGYCSTTCASCWIHDMSRVYNQGQSVCISHDRNSGGVPRSA
jgi:hypothetical protein